jgi:uncharacterized protein YqeY
MDILSQIESDFKQALKNKESGAVSTLRLLSAALTNEKISKKRAELEEEDVFKIIKSEIKKRKEAGKTGIGDFAKISARANG